MKAFYFFILILILLGVAVGLLTAWAKKQQKVGVMKWIIWGFWIFLTCFGFPLWSKQMPLKWADIFTFISTYGILALGLYGVYGEDRGPFLFPRMMVVTVIGMICRYFLEFGEVSNTYNFTLLNIVVYLFAAPVYGLLVYEFGEKEKRRLDKNEP